MPSIARPQKVYDFTAHARRQPTAPPPGDRIDAQLQNHADAITAVQVAVERLVQSAPAIDLDLEARVEARRTIEGELADLRRQVLNAGGLLYEARVELARVRVDADRARDVADRAEARLAAVLEARAEPRAPPAPATPATPTPPMPVGVLGPNAGGFFAGDDAGAAATSADYAQVSIEWAEHLPDTIPPNILAINAISGEHWSSRWWAIRAAGAFGAQAMWYQGAFGDPGPPTTPLTPTGDPIPPGAMYWNTDHNQMMVWDGSSWAAVGVPAAASSSSLFYEAIDGQTQFATTDPDLLGQSFQLRPDGTNGVNVFLNGIRLTFTRDYAVDAPTSTIALSTPAIGGSILALDVLVPQKDIAPGGVSIHKCRPLAPFDGVTTAFELQTTDGALLVVNGSNELLVVLDGVQQEPGVDYSATGDTLSFAAAPNADVKSFILWYTPVSEPAP
jgi:hypothetical protein